MKKEEMELRLENIKKAAEEDAKKDSRASTFYSINPLDDDEFFDDDEF